MNEGDSTLPAEGPWGPVGRAPKIPDYELIRLLGKGGFGVVWLAKSKSGVYRAVKLLRKGRVTEIEFDGIRTYETHIGNHPHLIDIRHVGETANHFYYEMELADGYATAPTFSPQDYVPHTLAGDLRRKGHLSLDEAIRITREILDGLACLHAHELLHRDVKPANIVFVEGVAKLADIGLLTRDRDRKVGGGTLMYTPTGGVVDRSGDLYCLGRVLFQMVSGMPPDRFPELPEGAEGADNEQRAALRRIMPIIDKACDPQPGERFQTAADFSAALDRAVGSSPSQSPRQRRMLVPLAVIAILAALVLVVVNLPGQSQRSASPIPAAAATTELPGHLDVFFKHTEESAVYFEISPEQIPLRTGELIQIHVTLGRPAYPIVTLLTKTDGVKFLFPNPNEPVTDEPVEKLILPADDSWWPLKPPGETLTFVLLAADRPVTDLTSLGKKLAALGQLPTADPDTMLVFSDGRVSPRHGSPGRSRGVDLAHPVRSTPGLLDRLQSTFADRFGVIYALAVPQVSRPP